MTFAQPFKDYEILERLGAGAMGTVFKARHKRLDRLVALKVLKPSLARNRNYVERLRREARIVASLNHPDIVAGYDLGEEGGYHFFVMEYVDAKSLATLLKEWGSFPEEQVLDVATRVASALDHAFKKGVIHRDIKPGNILIDGSGRAKLTDMGLAKAPEDAALTQEGATVGTPQYISPEQARDPSKADIRSDLYSLGATLFHMATGQPPFQGTTLAKVIHDVVHTRPPSAATLNPGLTDGLNLVIRKLMAKDPALRYATPAELLADLQRVRRAERPAVDEAALVEGESDVAPPRRVMPIVAGGVLVILAAVILVFRPWRGDDGGPPIDPTAAFAARLGSELAASEGYRSKLRLLAQAATAASTDGERRAVADLRSGMLISWQEAMVALVREQRTGLGEWLLRDEHWRDPQRTLRREVTDAVEARFQLTRPELPVPLPGVLEAELDRLAAELEPLVAERDAGLVAAWADHWEREVGPAWRSALDAQDYVGAARALATAGEFFGRAGRPRLDALPETLRRRLEAVDAPLRTEAAMLVDRAEAAAAEDLFRVSGQVLQQFAEQLRRGDDPRVVQTDHARWRRELAARHPDASMFRAGRDPWRRVGDLENAFGTEMDAAQRRADQRRLASNLQLALAALLVDGDAAQEIGWLREQTANDADVIVARDAAAAVLVGALRARDALLRALLQRTDGRATAFSDPVAIGRTLQLGVRVDGGRCELVERDGGRVSLAAVRVSEVRERAMPAAELTPEARRGLAVWHYLANESRAAAACLDPDVADLFRDHLVPAVQVVLRQRLGEDVEGRAALARLRDFKTLSTGALDAALAAFASRFGESNLALANAQFLDDVRSHLRERRLREAVLSALRSAVPVAFAVELSDTGEAAVRCEPAQAGELSLAPGWRRTATQFQFEGEEVGLPTVREQGFTVADALSTEHAVQASLSVALPAQGSRPRVWLFEVHGVGFAFGCAADGSPVATVVASEDLQREAVLQPRLERELEGLLTERPLPRIVPGARHELVLDVRVQPQRLAARLVFDGVELATGYVARSPKVVARTVVLPLQPLTLFAVRVVGRP